MIPGPASAPATCTFILRLRLEWTGESLTWRGWIEHLPSGTRAAVQDWAAVTAFMRGFGVDGEDGDEGRKTEDEEQHAHWAIADGTQRDDAKPYQEKAVHKAIEETKS